MKNNSEENSMIDQQLNSKKDCMGCYACASICPLECIRMQTDDEGFWYPLVDYDQCISCSQCIDACPIINKVKVNQLPTAYAAINRNQAIRNQSSSGGVFSLVAEKVLKEDGAVFGASFNEKFEIQHIFIKDLKDLNKLRGSKYVQSEIGDMYKKAKEFLDKGRKVLFSGTPCQIAGLKSYLGKEYSNLLSVDIVCHGVPSPKVWKKYLNFRERMEESKIRSISFRQKSKGWKRYSMAISFDNDTEYIKDLKQDSYMKAFLKDVCLRPSCYDCEFKSLERCSDITLADFWGIQSLIPEMDDDKGTSLIFIHSKVGKEIFDEIRNTLTWTTADIEEAVKFNSAVIRSAEINPKREVFLDNLDKMSFEKLVDKFCKDKLSTRIKKKLRSILEVPAQLFKKIT